MGVLCSIIEPTPDFLLFGIADFVHGRVVGAQTIGHDGLWLAVSFHGRLDEFECCGLVPGLAGKGARFWPDKAVRTYREIIGLFGALALEVFD